MKFNPGNNQRLGKAALGWKLILVSLLVMRSKLLQKLHKVFDLSLERCRWRTRSIVIDAASPAPYPKYNPFPMFKVHANMRILLTDDEDQCWGLRTIRACKLLHLKSGLERNNDDVGPPRMFAM